MEMGYEVDINELEVSEKSPANVKQFYTFRGLSNAVDRFEDET
jgi:hypothetical protein